MDAMGIHVEVWPVAADKAGIWLASGDDGWREPVPVPADSEPHAEVKLLLARYRAVPALVHSTSWRVDGPAVVLTYIAVLDGDGLVREQWPNARPVSAELARAVGRPPVHAAAEAPAPRYVDVLLHGLRHLRFLLDTDAVAAEALNAQWRYHLGAFTPALAGMYGLRDGLAA